MNKERRAELQDVADILEEADDRLQQIIMDEQDSFDNLPLGLQYSRTGESMEEAISDMETFSEKITNLSSEISTYSMGKKKNK